MELEEKYRLAIAALEKIAYFGHSIYCYNPQVPVYECACYDKDQRQLAQECLDKLNE